MAVVIHDHEYIPEMCVCVSDYVNVYIFETELYIQTIV